jgi:hypothetical protein
MTKFPSLFATSDRRASRFVTLTAALIALPVLAFAQDTTKSSILQNKADQQEVKAHTAALEAQVQDLIDELAANGISGDDAKVLQTTKSVLNSLSSEEMEKVISSLQKASDSEGTKDGEKDIISANAGQKGIILVFRQILKDYEQRQAASELPTKFKELTDRQTQVMWTTAQVASDVAGKSESELNTMQQTTAQIVQSDQSALVNDVAMAKQMLDKAAQDSSGDEGKAMAQAQSDLKSGALQKALDQANEDLKNGHLLQATTEQKVARDQLRQLAKDLNPPATTVDALADNAASLAKLIEEQKNLLQQTTAAIPVKPRVTGLDSKQGILVDKADSLSQDMLTLSPVPSGLVKDSITPMQMSRAQLGQRGGSFDQAVTHQQEAIAKLEEAQKNLAQQVADAQKAADEAAKDSTQKLEDLQKQIQTAMQQQQQVTNQTTQANNATPPDTDTLAKDQQAQTQLQQQTNTMQQAAQALSLPASQALANAASSMSKAEQDLTDPSKAADTQANQQAAQQALAAANQAVNQQIADNQQQAADPSALANAADNLQKAQDAVSSALADSTPQSSSTPQSGSTPPAGSTPPSSSTPAGSTPPPGNAPGTPPPTLSQAEAALAEAAKDAAAAAAVPGLPDAAASAVQDAEKSIAQGKGDAAKGDAPGTSAAAAAAQASLAQAQASVAVAQAGMAPGKPTPGGPPGSPMPGAPMPGMPSFAQSPPGPDMPSKDGAKNVSGGSTDKGKLHSVSGNGKFFSVISRDRSAIEQSQSENRPQEYAPMIDQYMKNLADQSSTSQ